MTFFHSHRIGIFVYSHPFRCRQLYFHTVILQHHLVITGRGFFPLVRESGTIPLFRSFRRPGHQFQIPDCRHQKDIPQIRMPRSAQMRMAEPDNCRIIILVSGTIPISIFLVNTVNIMRHVLRIGTQLHRSIRDTSPREGMSHTFSPDKGIHVIHRILFFFFICQHSTQTQ